MLVNAHEEKCNFQCKPMRLDRCRSSSSSRCTSFVSFYHICIHQHIDFFCIFVFDQGTPLVVALNMNSAAVLRVSIIITSARFCAVSSAASSFLEILSIRWLTMSSPLSPKIKSSHRRREGPQHRVVHPSCKHRRFCARSTILCHTTHRRKNHKTKSILPRRNA